MVNITFHLKARGEYVLQELRALIFWMKELISMTKY